MRRRAIVFLTGSLLLHGAVGAGGSWLARRAREAEARRREPKPVFAGETFDVASIEQLPVEATAVVAAPARTATARAEAPAPRTHHRRTRGDRAAGTAAPDAPLAFGALGDRSATSVVVAVVRGFPQAASTDPIWRGVPLGDAGDAVLEIDLAPDGTLARWSLGPGASPALRQAMVRTMAFIENRTFVATGPVTRMRLRARVSTDAVRDGDDAVYAIHAEHDGPKASAYFSLSMGRRIDLLITPVHSE